MAGLFFCLASDTVQGFSFCPDAIQPNTSVFSVFCAVNATLYHPRHKTARRALQWPSLRLHPLNRPRYQTDKSGYNTTCGMLEGITAPGRAQQIPDTTATLGRCTGQHIPPIIIRYIRGQTIHARRGLDASHARRLAVWHRVSGQGGTVWHPPPGGAVQRRAARNHWRLPPYLFSGFRPIANRGQQ